MKLWHDDIRRPPDSSWTWARTNEEAKSYLSSNKVTEASLDYDMGLSKVNPDRQNRIKLMVKEGYHRRGQNGVHLAQWLKQNPQYMPDKINIHSVNAHGRLSMAQVLKKQKPLLLRAKTR